ncbi:hypothetical protein KP509_08G031400 [Ceratopteris richardii]|uniref:Uncharacterized protein n=1 Tax=Ceratopteris richardii TaxID=49495 RepID=A0A8T2U700_CERRI|nr:hypothetical protein KP509_08G031400 [Ceratopteris richardii]
MHTLEIAGIGTQKIKSALSKLPVGDKWNKDNYHIWLYRMENFLMGKGLWELVNGEDKCPKFPENPNAEEQKEYKTWIEKSRKVLRWISICISESLIPHIMKANTPKEAWDITHKYMQKLHSVWRRNTSITDYVAEIRKITDDLGSINCMVDDDDMYKSLDTSISVRGTMPDFDELVALCMTEEVKLGLNASGTGNSRDRAFFHNRGRGSSREPSSSRNANRMDMSRGRGRSYSRGRGRSQAPGNCYHCCKYSQRERGRGHYASHGNFSAESSYRDYGRDNMVAMEHVLNSMSKPGNDMNWYIDSG